MNKEASGGEKTVDLKVRVLVPRLSIPSGKSTSTDSKPPEFISNLEKGIKAENMIARKLELRTKFRNQDIEQNHTWGIDIILNKKNKRIKIEVKSSQLFVKRDKGVRRGKFSIQLNDLEREIDYFAFVIYKQNEKVDTYWVRGEIIRKHFETRKRNKKLGLGIPTLLTRIPKVDFSEVIEL